MRQPALSLRLVSPMSGVEELRIRGFREPTLFSKGVRDSELVRYAGGALPVPAMRHEKWNSGTPMYESRRAPGTTCGRPQPQGMRLHRASRKSAIVYCPRCVNRNLPKKVIVHCRRSVMFLDEPLLVDQLANQGIQSIQWSGATWCTPSRASAESDVSAATVRTIKATGTGTERSGGMSGRRNGHPCHGTV
jgi:hypothetical protein